MNSLFELPLEPDCVMSGAAYNRFKPSDRFESLWDMLHFEAGKLMSALSILSITTGEFRSYITIMSRHETLTLRLPAEARTDIVNAIQEIRETCGQFGMKTSEDVAKDVYEKIHELLSPDRSFQQLLVIQMHSKLESLLDTFIAEASSKKFFKVQDNRGDYHKTADELFGKPVVDVFPSTRFDIREAGKALAFGLSTASVMHTMRVLEVGLRGLAGHLDIGYECNWNRTLDAVEKALRMINKREHGRKEEQWAAEAGTHLRFIKNAWRNQAAHPEATYDETEAGDIFNAARGFMQHLAEKLS